MKKSARPAVHGTKKPTRIRSKKRDIAKVDNTRDIDDVILAKGKIIQDLLGFSRENVTALFERAIGFLSESNFDAAIRSFSLLTRLNPYVADFWLGLGIATMNEEDYKRAFDAFSMALAMDPLRYDIYTYAIDCCLEMKNTKQADALLREAVRYARRNKNDEEAELILRKENELREKISSYKS